ncbi:MAG: response regulator [Myxococcales bacterium]|nr:MAG: response regulator [Myxococcales bacterium]
MKNADLNAERLSLALAAARLGDWHWDARSDVLTLSARAAELCGLPEGQASRFAQLQELIHEDDRELVAAALESAIRERGDYSVEHRLRVGNRERWVASSGRPQVDAAGELVGVVGVLQDVSGPRFLLAMDDALRSLVSSEEITYRAASLLGQHLNVDRCAYAAVEDDEDTFVITGNYVRGVTSIIGRYRFRQFGAECLRLMHAGQPYVVRDSESDARVEASDRDAYRMTAIRGVICVPIRKQGKFVAAMAVHTAAPRKWQPHEVELLQQVASRCGESIERARMERERQGLLQAAEAANLAKDEFLAMLGHELRNPLAPIQTALQLMRLRGDLVFQRERTVIERQVKHLTRLVDDLLDVARITRGQVELKPELVELSNIVARATEIAAPLLEQRAHDLTTRVPATGLTVHGDVARLTQVVCNLLTNAAKYTPPGGRITITATREGDELELSVADTGIGMSDQLLRRAFDAFAQGSQGSDRASGGLGLGLTIVRSLVERHGGRVSARSDGINRGSELLVRLPSAEAHSLATERLVTPLPRAPAASDMRVLIVDDNEDAADMLAEMLDAQGCRVKVAYDALAALRIAAEQAFDIGLLDIGLPVMDGYELAGKLRELRHLQNVSLVAVTGYGQAADRERAIAAGFAEHLVKPLDFTQLQRFIDSARR